MTLSLEEARRLWELEVEEDARTHGRLRAEGRRRLGGSTPAAWDEYAERLRAGDPLEIVIPGPASAPSQPVESAQGGRDEYGVIAWLDERELDRDQLVAARAGREFAAIHLGLAEEPRMRFCTGFRGDYLGMSHTTKNEIVVAIEHGVSLQTIADIAAHETYHRSRRPAACDDREERAAGSYGSFVGSLLVSRTANGGETVARVHEVDDWPGEFTLRGVAEYGDVVIATAYGGRRVFVQVNSKSAPRWQERRCPVS